MKSLRNVLIGASIFCSVVGVIFLIFVDTTSMDRLLSVAIILFGIITALNAFSAEKEG
jgi:nitrogen fixation-related uncharacterized protein